MPYAINQEFNHSKKYYQKILPKNIKIILLPPYCKELNLVERLWKYIKNNVIRNKIFETLLELELAVCDFVRNLSRLISSKVFAGIIIMYYRLEIL